MSALLIESSTRTPKAALYSRDGSLRSAEGGLAEQVRSLVEDWSGIELFGISVGPGSFTGLRVGLSILKGLAFVHPRPVVAVSSLRLWAASAEERDRAVLPVLDARRQRVFAGLFAPQTFSPDPALPEAAYTVEDLQQRVDLSDLKVVGDGAGLLGVEWEGPGLSMQALGRLAFEEERTARPAADVEPRYLLKTQIEEELGV